MVWTEVKENEVGIRCRGCCWMLMYGDCYNLELGRIRRGIGHKTKQRMLWLYAIEIVPKIWRCIGYKGKPIVGCFTSWAWCVGILGVTQNRLSYCFATWVESETVLGIMDEQQVHCFAPWADSSRLGRNVKTDCAPRPCKFDMLGITKVKLEILTPLLSLPPT